MKKFLTFVLFVIVPLLSMSAQQLSYKSQVSILTVDDGDEIYSTYGHSAIRISDPIKGYDYVYNYGVFNFNDPNFVGRFVLGNLLYRLGIVEFDRFVLSYRISNQTVSEQILDLSLEKRQQVFDYLNRNLLPENVNYRYDYFHENCATKVYDLFAVTLGDSLDLNIDRENYRNEGFRGMIKPHLQGGMEWAKFGIDFITGYKIDKEVIAEKTMFLPKNLESIFASAKVFNNNQWVPIVKNQRVVYKSRFKPYDSFSWWLSPMFVCWMLFVLVFIISLIGWIKGNQSWVFERVLWSINTLMGFLLVFLWFFTEHQAFGGNLNVLWLSPLSLVFLFKGSGVIGRTIKKSMSMIIILMTVFWWFAPQSFNTAAFPLLLIFVVRIIKRIEGNFNHIKE